MPDDEPKPSRTPARRSDNNLLLPKQTKRKRKSIVLKKFIKGVRTQGEYLISPRTFPSERRKVLQKTINHLCIRPTLSSEHLLSEDEALFMTDVLSSFKREKAQRSFLSRSRKLLMTSNTTDMVENGLESGIGAPMGFGLMEIEMDRTWITMEVLGTAHYSGVIFEDHINVICDHLSQLESKELDPATSLAFVHAVTDPFAPFSALENISTIQSFIEGDNVVRCISSGYNCVALVSSLGKVFLTAPISEYAIYLGVPQPPPDWQGILQIDSILGRRVKWIACGRYHNCIITETSEVIIWGINTIPVTNEISGQLGNHLQSVSPPFKVVEFAGIPLSVSCGTHHTVILTSEGVYTCGSNSHGQLGSEDPPNHFEKVKGIIDSFNVPCRVSTISCGAYHTLISTQEGLVFAWGSNECGQLGFESKEIFVFTPVCISVVSVISVACGESHSMILDNEGKVKTFGSNAFGQLGISDSIHALYIPTIVCFEKCKGSRIVNIFAGPFCSMAVTDWGAGYSWGMLHSAHHTQHQFTPRLLGEPYEKDLFLVSVGSGISHTIILDDTDLSTMLSLMRKACHFELPFGNIAYLKQIKSISCIEKVFLGLQSRIHTSIDTNIPRLEFDSILTFNYSPLRNIYTRNVTLRNPTDSRIEVKIHVVNQRAYKLIVNSPSYKISKRSEIEIQISLLIYTLTTCHVDVIQFIVSKQEAPKKQEPGTLMSMSQYFLPCKFIPIDERVGKSSESQTQTQEYGLKLVHSLATYVPRVLAEYFVVHPNPPQQPHIQQFPAAILFLDISGFTSLNERLAKMGSNGPEIVSKHINSYFSQLIRAVSDQGGDVLKFAGDALICMWKDTSATLKTLTLRAIHCGLDIQRELAIYDSNEGFSLTLHIGVGSGELLSLWVGSVGDSWEYLVSGEPLAQLRTAVDNSKSGQVVVSSQTWDMIKDQCTGEAIGDDFWVQNLNSEISVVPQPPLVGWPRADAETALRCFIPLAVQVSVDSQQLAGWQNELRSATVLFVKLNTVLQKDDKEAYLSHIHLVLGCMQKVVLKYSGMIRQFLADDKGTVLIAAFGVPPLSHIDDPVRGIKAALDIHSGLLEVGMDSSIGVTTGNVFCGSVGSKVRQEYAMVGDTVNLSARLMIAAFKQKTKVLCDYATYLASKDVIRFQILPPIHVKGKEQQIRIYSPSKEEKIDVYCLPRRFLQSKRKEFAHTTNWSNIMPIVCEMIENCKENRNGATQILIIEAAQGMKKSAFTHETMCKAVEENIIVAFSKAVAFSHKPLQPFATIITDALSLSHPCHAFAMAPDYDSSFLQKKLCELIGPIWSPMIPLLNDILPLKINENEQTLSIPEVRRVEELSSLLYVILNELSDRNALLIIIDHVHWLDEYSKMVLKKLAKTPRIHFMFSLRSQMEENNSVFPVENPHSKRILLKPLTIEESVTYVQSLLHVDDIPQAVIKILSKAQGNPFLLSQIVERLLEGELISIEHRCCNVVGDLQNVSLTGVARLLNSTLDKFSAVQQMIMKVASVIGYRFEFGILWAIFPANASQKKFLGGEIEVLIRLHVLSSTSTSSVYQVNNLAFLEAVHSRLTMAQRLELHLHIAQWYEEKDATNFPRLGYHWAEVVDCMEDPSFDTICKAISYLRKSGERSQKVSANETWKWWTTALHLALTLPEPQNSKLKKEIQLQLMGNKMPRSSINFGASILDLRAIAGVSRPMVKKPKT